MNAGSQGRLKDRTPVSVIDIGSNSIRLVVYEGIARAPTVLFNEKMLAGLGRGIVSTGRLDPQAVERALEEFARFRALSQQAGSDAMHVIATAAAREAENGPEFIERAGQVLGTEIQVLSGRQEAHYSALGIISAFREPDGIIGDLGGGSLELVDLRGKAIGDGITLPLGGLRLADMTGGKPDKVRAIIREQIARADLLNGGRGRAFYAVGGTWRNLARLHMVESGYPLNVMHHYEMEPERCGEFLDLVADGNINKMNGIKRVSKNRRALLPYGAAILREIIAAMKPERIVISAVGVREGYLYSLLEGGWQEADPLLTAADELAVLRSRSAQHARELAEWTGPAFAAMGLDETADESRYRRAACLVADIGWRAHPEYRGTQSLNIIAHASFIGIDHPGRAFIALASLYRHEGLIDDAVAPEIRQIITPRLMERAKALGALLRVVYLLSASMPGVIPRLTWRIAPSGALQLVIPKDREDLMGERPKGRMAHLSAFLSRDMELVVGE